MSIKLKHCLPGLVASVALVSLTIISYFLVNSLSAFAENSVIDDVSITINVACNVTATGSGTHSANIVNGTYESEIGTTDFKVICNDTSGYSIYAIGYSDQEYGNTKLLANINGSAAPTYDIVTGTNTSGGTSNWAMKLMTTGSTSVATITNGYGSYSLVPATYTKVATLASSTDLTIGSTLQSTYAAFIAGNQPAGTYSGKVKYTLVHPANETPLAPQPTVAGKMMEKHSDLFIVQWETQVKHYKNAVYGGCLY